MPIVKANGIDLAYDSFGDEADKTIMLIAGLSTQMIRWTVPFCAALAARGYRVIRFDNRDTGRSTHFHRCAPPDFGALAAALMAGQRPDVPYTLYDMAADAIGLLDALAIDKAHVVGRSMGGMIAQILASEHPGRVLSLTSIMSSTGNPMLPQAAPDVMAMMTRPSPDPVSDEAGFLAHRLAFARRIAGSGHPFDEESHRLLILEETRRAHDPGGSARQIAAMAVSGDRRPRLAMITAPTLVIHGTEDPVFRPECGRDTAASIPNADLMLVDGMGHDLPPTLYGTVIETIDRTASPSTRNVTGNAPGCASATFKRPGGRARICVLSSRVPQRHRKGTDMPVITSRRALLLGIPALVLAVGAVKAGAMMRSVPDGLDLALDKPTTAGLYKAAIVPQATPVPVGSMHAWTVTVRTPTGAPVTAARIGINGGMPQHGHGLPTAPQVTKDLGDGRYLIEGMKFNMRGWWTLDLAIDGLKGPDTVTFNLVL